MPCELEFTHSAYLSDEEIGMLFKTMVSDGCYRRFFSLKQQCTSAREFIEYARRKTTWLFSINLDGNLAGFGVCDEHIGDAMYIHVCLFKSAVRESVNIGETALKWLGEKLKGIKTLVGAVPSSNILAVRYMDRLGFKILGTIPNSTDTDYGVTGTTIGYYELEK